MTMEKPLNRSFLLPKGRTEETAPNWEFLPKLGDIPCMLASNKVTYRDPEMSCVRQGNKPSGFEPLHFYCLSKTIMPVNTN